MFKFLFPLTAAMLMFGCAQHADDLGRRSVDTPFPKLLNRVEQVESNAPRNYSDFTAQADKVVTTSPSLAATYQPLYEALNRWIIQSGDPSQLAQFGVETAQLGGVDQQGNVLFTGYYSPVMTLRHQPDAQYQYPVYGHPQCDQECPTRAQIYQGALKDQGLELGYSDSLIDPFMMEVQGSGFVNFAEDGQLNYFAYAGKNNRAYVSIGRVLIERGEVEREAMSMKVIREWVAQHDETSVRELLEQNPSYVFFSPQDEAAAKGTAGVPLLPMASVAGDRTIFPMGTPILAEVPLLNADGSWSGVYQLRLLIVLDTGGAVTGNHLDLYHGMGAHAGQEAGHYKHFGRVWKLGLEHSATAAPWALSPEKRE